jgi:Bacterial PH domain
MIFRSKVDLWVILLIATEVLLSAKVAVNAIQNQSAWLTAFFSFCFGIALPISLITFTRYKITSDSILVHSGPFKWNILLSSVRKIEATKTLGSAPAMSLNRLRKKWHH